MKTQSIRILAISAIFVSVVTTSFAQSTWNGGGANDLWSTNANWSTNASPAGTAVFFGNTDKTSFDTPNNIVDGNYSISSLTYNNTGNGSSNWQVTQINSLQTLTVSGGFSVGATSSNSTLVKIQGDGTLTINDAAATFQVGTLRSSATSTNLGAVLDMSALSHFNATVNLFAVGVGAGTLGTALLSKDNTITATALVVGDRGSSGAGSATFPYVNLLSLGASNDLKVDGIYIGAKQASPSYANSQSGKINFQDVAGATVKIRGAAGGTSRASMTVGNIASGTGSTGADVTAVADFTGGSIDAMLSTVIIGRGNQNVSSGGNGTMNAVFAMNAGTVDATSVMIGESNANGGATGVETGSLTVGGGTFTAGSITVGSNTTGATPAVGNLNVLGGAVNVTGNIIAGARAGTATAASNINVAGGVLTVDGSLAENNTGNASITSTVRLKGGTLDMTNGTITVDAVVAESGTLKNVAQISTRSATGVGLTKTGAAGVLILSGANAFTGGITINAGTLLLDSGALPSTGSITVNSGGALAYNAAGLQALLAGGRVVMGATPGSIALTSANSGENVNFNTAGMTNGYLGALGDITYSGTYTPYTAGLYRLGGGLGTLTYAGNVTGTDAVEIGGGAGTVILSGANTYNGGTSIKAGATLRLTALDDIGSGGLTLNGGILQWANGFSNDVSATNAMTIAAGGGTIDTNGNNVSLASAISGTGPLTKAGGGILSLTGTNLAASAVNAHAGTLALGAGALSGTASLTLSGGTVRSVASQTLGAVTLAASSGSSIVANSGTTFTLGSTWTRNAGSTVNINTASGGVVASNPTLTNDILPWATVTDGTGTYFATASGGNLVGYTSAGALGTGSNGATTNYSIATGLTTTSVDKTINSLAIINTTAQELNLNNRVMSLTSGAVLMTGSADFTISNGQFGASNQEFIIHHFGTGILNITALVAGSALNNGAPGGGTGSVTKDGSGTVVLSENNAYSGATTITGGVVSVSRLDYGGLVSGIGRSTSDAANLILNGGTLRYTGVAQSTDRDFTVGANGGRIESSGTGALNWMGSMTASSTSGSQTLTLAGTNTGKNTFAGTIRDGAGTKTSLVKDDAGTWMLTGTNTFTGTTTVSAGTLIVGYQGLGSLGNTAVTVANGGTLGGSGTIVGSVSVASGGRLAPGNSPGILSTGSVSFASGSTLAMELNSAVLGTGYDQLNVAGSVSLNGDLALTLNFAPIEDQTFVLINNDGSDAISGAFSTINGVAAGGSFALVYNSVSYDFILSYNGGINGNDLVIQAVPEPHAWILLLGAGLVFYLRRRIIFAR